jgi:hypothetical protein
VAKERRPIVGLIIAALSVIGILRLAPLQRKLCLSLLETGGVDRLAAQSVSALHLSFARAFLPAGLYFAALHLLCGRTVIDTMPELLTRAVAGRGARSNACNRLILGCFVNVPRLSCLRPERSNRRLCSPPKKTGRTSIPRFGQYCAPTT